MNSGLILTKVKPKNQQNCQKPVFTVDLPLTEYCERNLRNLQHFYLQKSAEICQFSGEIGQFSQ